jgi:hypothetical protein
MGARPGMSGAGGVVGVPFYCGFARRVVRVRLMCRVRGRMGGGFRIVVGVVVVVRHGVRSIILPRSMQRFRHAAA